MTGTCKECFVFSDLWSRFFTCTTIVVVDDDYDDDDNGNGFQQQSIFKVNYLQSPLLNGSWKAWFDFSIPG